MRRILRNYLASATQFKCCHYRLLAIIILITNVIIINPRFSCVCKSLLKYFKIGVIFKQLTCTNQPQRRHNR